MSAVKKKKSSEKGRYLKAIDKLDVMSHKVCDISLEIDDAETKLCQEELDEHAHLVDRAHADNNFDDVVYRADELLHEMQSLRARLIEYRRLVLDCALNNEMF